MKQKCMEANEILFRTMVWLEDPKGWRVDRADKTATAWDAVASCDPLSLSAEAWSVEGAAIRVSGNRDAFGLIKPHLLAFCPRLGAGGGAIAHEQVLSLLRGAWMHAEMTERLKR